MPKIDVFLMLAVALVENATYGGGGGGAGGAIEVTAYHNIATYQSLLEVVDKGGTGGQQDNSTAGVNGCTTFTDPSQSFNSKGGGGGGTSIHQVVELIKTLPDSMMVDIMVVVVEVVDHMETQHLSCQVVPQLKLIQ